MEGKEKSGLEPKENSTKTKMVLLVQRPNGSAFVKSFETNGEIPTAVVLKDSTPIALKEFDAIPKRMSFFFEKGFAS